MTYLNETCVIGLVDGSVAGRAVNKAVDIDSIPVPN